MIGDGTPQDLSLFHVGPPEGIAPGIEIEIAIKIEVGRGQSQGGCFRNELAHLHRKAPSSVVLHEDHAQSGGEGEVLVTIVVEVEEKSALGLHPEVGAREGGGIDDGAIRSRDVEAIGKPSRFANIEIVQAVPIHVAHRQPMPAGETDSITGFKPGGPVVHPVIELLRKFGKASEDRLGNVAEERPPWAFGLLEFRDCDRFQGGRLIRRRPVPVATPPGAHGQGAAGRSSTDLKPGVAHRLSCIESNRVDFELGAYLAGFRKRGDQLTGSFEEGSGTGTLIRGGAFHHEGGVLVDHRQPPWLKFGRTKFPVNQLLQIFQGELPGVAQDFSQGLELGRGQVIEDLPLPGIPGGLLVEGLIDQSDGGEGDLCVPGGNGRRGFRIGIRFLALCGGSAGGLGPVLRIATHRRGEQEENEEVIDGTHRGLRMSEPGFLRNAHPRGSPSATPQG